MDNLPVYDYVHAHGRVDVEYTAPMMDYRTEKYEVEVFFRVPEWTVVNTQTYTDIKCYALRQDGWLHLFHTGDTMEEFIRMDNVSYIKVVRV
jgi:hypothetical protein